MVRNIFEKILIKIRLFCKGRVQKPQSQKIAAQGYPPPLFPPSRKATGLKVNGRKLAGKGGNPSLPSRKAACQRKEIHNPS